MRPKIIYRRGTAAQLTAQTRENYFGEIALMYDVPKLVMWDGFVWRDDLENFASILTEHYKKCGYIKDNGTS